MILQSKRVWILNEWMEAQIEVSTESGKIERIRPYGSGQADMDFGDLRVVPGFIDVHTHGAYGFDTNDAEEEGLRNWVQNIVGEGVTGFLPTTITQSEEVLTKALKNVAKVAREQKTDRDSVPGAEILGIHLEGPYLGTAFRERRYWAYIWKGLISVRSIRERSRKSSVSPRISSSSSAISRLRRG